jgi:uncharacterized protein with HEPN domain
MKRDISLYLKDILKNMEKAEKFTEDMSYKNFVADEKTKYAILRCIEIMGEAVKGIPESVRKKYAEVPWKDIAGMRDKVIHFYFGIKLKRVWLAVKEDIPKIKHQIKKILKDISGETKRGSKK